MMSAKSTNKSTTKAKKISTKVVSAKPKKTNNKPSMAKVAKAKTPALKSSATKKAGGNVKNLARSKNSTKASNVKARTSTIKVVDFVAGILKQANKAQKIATSQCKVLNRQVDGLDKKYAQLSKKQSSSNGRSLKALEKQLNKIKIQTTVVRTSLLKAEDNRDKIVGLLDFISKLNARATT